MSRITFVILIAVVTGTLVASQAVAQSPGRSGQGGLSTGHLPQSRAGQDPKGADVPITLAAQVQAILERTADELRINAGQEKEWNTYAMRLLRLADDISRARFAAREIQNESITASQAFDRATEAAQNRLTAVEEIVEAGRALYARLTPEQQRLADRKLAIVALSLANGVAPPAGPGKDDGSTAGPKPRGP